MANPPGSLNLAALDFRLVDALRDTVPSSASRYMYLEDAYSRLWYKHPWAFTHALSSFAVATATNEYVLSDEIAEVAALFNATQQKYITMNKGMFMYFQSYRDDSHGGPLYTNIDIRETGGKQTVIFGEVPGTGSADLGVGDTIQVYYCKHIIHNDATGGTATGNMTIGTNVPSFSPQFHTLIMKEALIEAIKNRRDFQEMYQLAVAERDEMLKDMRRHYMTPQRQNTVRIYR